MVCFGWFSKKKKGKPTTIKEKIDDVVASRPQHRRDASYVSLEKPLLFASGPAARATAALPPAIASLKPIAHPGYSAYAAAADGKGPQDGGELRHRGVGRTGPADGDTGPDDEESKKADAARRKAEQEEQERLDFLQWM